MVFEHNFNADCTKLNLFSSNSAFVSLILQTVDKGNSIDQADFIKILY